ncbi:hypothetical protein PG989_002205 [Apiospora arundinis]
MASGILLNIALNSESQVSRSAPAAHFPPPPNSGLGGFPIPEPQLNTTSMSNVRTSTSEIITSLEYV